MTKSSHASPEDSSTGGDEKNLRQAAIEDAPPTEKKPRPITGKFRALMNKSSGSIRAINGELAELLRIAPDVIRAGRGDLDEDEVDEIVSNLVDDVLDVTNPEWLFLREPERRKAMATIAIRKFVKTQVRGRRLRRKVAAQYWDERSDASIWQNPLAKIYVDELEAAVEEALGHMSEARRAVYIEAAFSGLPLKEVAELTGQKLRNVIAQKVDGNRMVREAVRAMEEGRPPRFPKKGRPRRQSDRGQSRRDGGAQ